MNTTTRALAPLLACALAALTPFAHATTGGPDAYGYTWIDNNSEPSGPTYEWISPSSSSTVVIAGAATAAATIDLEIPWGGIYGTPVSQLRVSRNGFLSSDITDPGGDETNDCPLPATPSQGGGNRLYLLHDNLELDPTNGEIRYEYFSESPHSANGCGVHVITWQNVHHPSPDATRFSFQALLFDNLDILFQYGPGNPESGLGSTTGIQNAAATIGLNVTCDAKEIPDDYAVLISPPTLTVTTEDDEFDTPSGAALSLREAVRDAASGTRIEFDSALNTRTIDMSVPGGGQGGRIDIDAKALCLDASALAKPLAISGKNALRQFYVENGGWASFRNLRIEEGFNAGPAGGTRVLGGSTLIACQCSWQDNASNSSGGAIQVEGSSRARFYFCDFLRNGTNNSGGAISGRTGGSISAEKCRFWRNTGGNDGTGEAGAFSLNGATAKLDFCDLALNASPGNGGAITANVNSVVNCYGCTFDNNRAVNGGAVAATNAPSVTGTPAIASFDRCTFYENLALNLGGAIYEASETTSNLRADLVFRYCTMINNTAGVNGGGIYVTTDGPSILMAASIMADNMANISPNNFAAAGIGVIDATPGDNIESGSDGDFGSNGGLSNVSPALAPLGYYGGFVRTCVLLQGSVGIDSVTVETFSAGIDARGLPGKRNSGISLNSDAGAVEMGPPLAVTSSAASGAGSLQEAILSVEDGGVITFSGVDRVDLTPGAAGGQFSLIMPPNRAFFIDGSSNGRVTINQLAFSTSTGTQIALQSIDAFGHDGASLSCSGAENLCSSSLTLSDCRIQGYAPTIGLIPVYSYARAAVLGSHIENNQLLVAIASVRGGGTGATLIARDSHFSCNETQESEFASYGLNASGGLLLVQRCSLVENTIRNGAADAGIIWLGSNILNQVPWGYIENTTISGNRIIEDIYPTSAAGAVMARALAPHRTELHLVHCTIIGNEIEDAGGAVAAKTAAANVTITNTILAGNLPAEEFGTLTSLGGNLSDSSPAFFAGADTPNTDPLLSALVLGRNGTLHHVPRPGSPCVDAAQLRDAGAIDGRGVARFIDGDGLNLQEADIGAVESGRVLTVTTATDEDDGGLGVGAGDSLRECIEQASTFGAVNVGFAAGLISSTLPLSSQILLDDHVADVDGLDTEITVTMALNGIRTFRTEGEAALSIHGFAFDSLGGIVRVNDDTAFTMESCLGFGATIGTVEVEGAAAARLANSYFRDNTTTNRVIWARLAGRIDAVHCTFARNSTSGVPVSGVIFNVRNDAAVSLKYCTFAENAIGGATVALDNNAQGYVDRCTFARNGWAAVAAFSDSQLRFRDSIHQNNVASVTFVGPGANRTTLGGNISDESVTSFDPALGDLEDACPYLAPLADYDGDGLPEMPPLAASPVFNQPVGATDPPTEVITVNTSDDQDNTPAGSFISLREAIRDITPGGTIVFDPSLNDAEFNIVNNGGTIEATVSVSIDATSLPNGIDTVGGRLFSDTPGLTLAIHGIHMRDFIAAGGTSGGSVQVKDGSVIASHCAFSGNSLTTPSSGGALSISRSGLVAQNCSFSDLKAVAGSAIYMGGSTGRIEFCSFSESSPFGLAAVIQLDPSSPVAASTLELYASVFDRNGSLSTPADSIRFAAGSALASLGYNAFPDAPAGSVGSDQVNVPGLSSTAAFTLYDPFTDFGGWVETYRSKPLVGVEDTLPAVTQGEVPPPATDARGYPRIFGASADYGANEFGGSIVDSDGDFMADWYEWFYGLNPNDPSDANENPDGDAGDNLVEFLLRKDPFTANITVGDPATIEDVTINPGSVQLDWTGTTGHFYLIEESPDLETFTPFTAIYEGNGTAQFNLIPLGTNQFWRLRAFQCN